MHVAGSAGVPVTRSPTLPADGRRIDRRPSTVVTDARFLYPGGRSSERGSGGVVIALW